MIFNPTPDGRPEWSNCYVVNTLIRLLRAYYFNKKIKPFL